MTTGQMLWAGLLCCIVSLCVQLFPAAAFTLGIDIGATWRLFGFGVFLISIASFMAAISGRAGR